MRSGMEERSVCQTSAQYIQGGIKGPHNVSKVHTRSTQYIQGGIQGAASWGLLIRHKTMLAAITLHILYSSIQTTSSTDLSLMTLEMSPV